VTQAVEPPQQEQILFTGQVRIDGCELAGQADAAAHVAVLTHDIITIDSHFATVRRQQGA
jgi:hypothetical protein